MGRYLERLKAKKGLVSDPPKLTKVIPSVVVTATTNHEKGFVGFDGARGRGFPELWGRYGQVFTSLELGCPEHVPPTRWRQAIEDGRAFLARWGQQAEALGWTAKDMFSLHNVPEKPHPSYSRLSRYNETGLLWLLQGGQVIALTETTAAIQQPTGNVTIYHRYNKPALGPIGDSLDDLR
jgi:hypothetical protein